MVDRVFVAASLSVLFAACVSSPLDSDEQAEAILVPAETGEGTLRLPAVAQLQMPQEWSLSSSVGGLVTSGFELGEIASGQMLGSLDGKNLVALHSDRPFHRIIADGAQGPDVAALRTILADSVAGYQRSGPDPVVAQDLTAIGQLNDMLGFGGSDSFDPANFVWLPTASGSVQWSVALGEYIPDRTQLGTFSADDGAAFLSVEGGEEVASSLDDLVFSPSQSGLEIQVDSLEAPGQEAVDSLLRLTVSTEPGPPDRGGGPSSGGQVSIEGTLLGSAGEVAVLPVTALRQSSDESCVVTEERESVRVTVVGGEAGVVELEGLPADGQRFIANPAALGIAGCD